MGSSGFRICLRRRICGSPFFRGGDYYAPAGIPRLPGGFSGAAGLAEGGLGNIKQVSFGKSVIYTYNQPPIRVFYRTRNTILFIKKYHDRELRTTKLKELLKDFIRLWFEKKRILKIFMYIKGIIIGTVWRY